MLITTKALLLTGSFLITLSLSCYGTNGETGLHCEGFAAAVPGAETTVSDTTVTAAGETTRQTAPTPEGESGAAATPAQEARPGFFKRFIDYFKNSNQDKTTEKKFDFSIIGGPHYSSDTKLGLGLVASGLYRIDRNDLSIPPSNVSLFGDFTTTGFWLLGIRGNTLLNGAKYRIDYTTYFFSFPSAFWGIGYDNGAYAERSSYKRKQAQFKVDFLYRLARNFYIGTNGSFSYVSGKDFRNIEYLQGQATYYRNVGIGLFLMYDSRDFIPNPYKGLYLKLEQIVYPKSRGRTFTRTEFTGDVYTRLWKGGILAYDLHAVFNSSRTPWTNLALMGGSQRMRGYYEGRYRDRNLIEMQLELRQRIYGRSGIAVWVGAGNVFPDFKNFNPSHTLPNYGIGYRWEFKNRVNVRLDYGFGKNENSFLFSINEAF